MLLREFSGQYFSARDLSVDHRRQIGWTIDRLDRFLSRQAELTDLTDVTANRWLDSMIGAGLARRTVKNQRTNLLCLWRDAYSLGLVASPPLRVKKIICQPCVPRGETREKMAALLAEARKLEGRHQASGVERAKFWTALILFMWETGVRIGDALQVRREDISGGIFAMPQHKTAWPVVRALSKECLAALAEISSDGRPRIFGDALSRGHAFRWFRRLAKSSGFCGGTKTIRKSGASAVESITPGAAMSYLGHKTPGVAYRHYIDPRLIQQSAASPPPLTAGD